MSPLLRVFIGYDPVESVAWHTMAHSIFSQSSIPVAIVPLNIRNLNNIYKRSRDPKQSNEFSFTRFLVPYLSEYKGYSVFFDCDMLLTTDISSILNAIEYGSEKAVYVVKHDYVPKNSTKFLGTVQYAYPRKNWSSVVLWNCAHRSNKSVTPEYVNTASAMELHRFMWLDDDEIGSLDIGWNWLVGEYENPPKKLNNIHWTIGGPYFNEYQNVDFSSEWKLMYEQVVACRQREDI